MPPNIGLGDAVEYAMATRFQADKDLVIIKNVRGSSLDPSSDQNKKQYHTHATSPTSADTTAGYPLEK